MAVHPLPGGLSWPPAHEDEARLRSLPPGSGRLRIEDDGTCVELVLDHPEVRNALSAGMMLALLDFVRARDAAPPRFVLIRGEGTRAFCSGGDLRAVRDHLIDRSAGGAMSRVMGAALDRVASWDTVVVGAVEGVALGGGAELLTCCDHIVCSSAASVGFVHAALGVSPGWGGGHRLRARIGRHATLEVLAGARRLGAEQALRLGVVDELCEPGGTAARARAWIDGLARHPEASVRTAVRIAQGLDAGGEAEAFGSLWGGPAHRAALGLETS